MGQSIQPTGVERFFDDNDIIVSKTDLKGRITYANKVFLDVSGYKEREVLGQPHNMIRHPEMPRCIFKLLWDCLTSGKEIFAYVNNCAKNGDHYWVYAHVTPSWDRNGQVVGFHSNRRVPDRAILDKDIIPLYSDLRSLETSHRNAKQGMQAATERIDAMLADLGIGYDEFMATIGQGRRRGFR
ncbi:MAG: PAS domain-containing protein [Cohaesibacter sp.]|nr:PAS domain-containing protein [Cohaesibacter sp.]MCV6600891.1 PAS domain-containing protein [Cohaesibacter sp.]